MRTHSDARHGSAAEGSGTEGRRFDSCRARREVFVHARRVARAEPLSAVRLGCQQRREAVVVLAAGRAALEVRAHARHDGVRVAARALELNLAVELLEALLAGQLRAGGSEQPGKQVGGSRAVVVAHERPPRVVDSSASPCSESRARSLRRASCRVL